MRRAYILVYSVSVGSRDQLKEWLNEMPEVSHWRYDLPNCFYIVSEESARQLSDAFRSHTGTYGRFLISEVTSNKQGWLPADTWYLLNNKRYKPKE